MTDNHRRLGLALPLVAAGLLLATGLLLAAEASGQTPLVDAARRERARRAAIPPEEKARVYTNEDLWNSGGLTIGVVPAGGAAPVSPEPGDAPEAAPDEGQPGAAEPEATAVRDEDYWRTRIATARDAQARAALMAAALQNRSDGLWAQFTAIDDPVQRGIVERQRLEALGALEETRAERDRLDGEIREIEDEARRAGVPPGWLRDTGSR